MTRDHPPVLSAFLPAVSIRTVLPKHLYWRGRLVMNAHLEIFSKKTNFSAVKALQYTLDQPYTANNTRCTLVYRSS